MAKTTESFFLYVDGRIFTLADRLFSEKLRKKRTGQPFFADCAGIPSPAPV